MRSLCLILAFTLTSAVVSATPERPPPLAEVGVDERVGARLPLDLRFVSSTGQSVRLGDVVGNGKPTLLVLAYNRCAMLCSLVLRSVSGFVDESSWVPGERYAVVAVGINPRESPHEAARTQASVLSRAGYAGERQRWPFLIGDAASITTLADRLGFKYAWDPRSEQYAHPAVVFAIAPDGRIAQYFYGLNLDTKEVEAALASGVDSNASYASTTQIASHIKASILSCFRFETVSNLYGAAVQNGFRIGALAVFLTLLGFVTFLFKRERRAP